MGNSAYKNANYKSAFKLYSRGLELCPEDHPERVILLSNRAQVAGEGSRSRGQGNELHSRQEQLVLHQVLITAQAFHLALRDIATALMIDPLHEKTLLR